VRLAGNMRRALLARANLMDGEKGVSC